MNKKTESLSHSSTRLKISAFILIMHDGIVLVSFTNYKVQNTFFKINLFLYLLLIKKTKQRINDHSFCIKTCRLVDISVAHNFN